MLRSKSTHRIPPANGVLLVSDIDGTLTEQGGPLPRCFIDLVDEFRRQGGRFTLATGRPLDLTQQYIEQLAVREPVICLNGACVYDPSGRPRELHSLPEQVAKSVMRALADGGHPFIAYRRGRAMVFGADLNADWGQREVIGSWDRFSDSIQKITVLGPEAPADTGLPSELRWVRSSHDCFDLMPGGVSKGSSLRRLAMSMGTPLDSIATVGDNLNDVEMTLLGAAGVAVSNAHVGLKSRASHITTGRSWEGVSEVITAIIDGSLLGQNTPVPRGCAVPRTSKTHPALAT